MLETYELPNELTWIMGNQLAAQENKKLKKNYHLNENILKFINKERASAHFEYDEQNDCGFLIWEFSNDISNSGAQVQTQPLYIVFKKGFLLTISPKASKRIKQLITEIPQAKSTINIITWVFEIIRRLTENSVQQIDRFDSLRNKLSHYYKLPSETQIKQLASLNESLIYLTTSANHNLLAIKQLKIACESTDSSFSLSQHEHQKLQTVLAEITEVKQMLELSTSLTEQTSSTYNNIFNTSLNNTMRFLTIWSLALAIPPIISSFYGQNIFLPFAKQEWAWPFTIALSLFFILLLLYLFKKKFH